MNCFSLVKSYLFYGLFCCMLPLYSCGSAPISMDRLAEVTVEMFKVDQLIQDQPRFFSVSDTTLVYAAVLRKYGYSVQDYHRSLTRHIQRPEKFKNALVAYRDQMVKQRDALQKEIDEAARRKELKPPPEAPEMDDLFYYYFLRIQRCGFSPK